MEGQLRSEVQQDIRAVQQALLQTSHDPSTTITSTLPSEPTPVIPLTFTTPLPTSVVKSCHIKLSFTTFGRPSEDADPLLN